jgi:hypothetical protein
MGDEHTTYPRQLLVMRSIYYSLILIEQETDSQIHSHSKDRQLWQFSSLVA